MGRPKLPPNKHRFVDNKTIEIELTKYQTCLIDASDYDLIKEYHWYYNKYKKANSGYVLTRLPQIDGKRKTLKMHRLLMSCTDTKQQVDHINMNGTDNRRSNLRVCTHQENMMNKSKRKDNTSGFKGVTFNKKYNKYQSQIMFNNKRIYLGYFKDPIEAAKSYDAKALELFGDFAVLNFRKTE